MYKIVSSKQFKRDLKISLKRGYDLNKLKEVVNTLASGDALPKKHKDHNLSGKYSKFRECHIEPDWLLVYRADKECLELFLFRNGTHSDLFR